MHVAKSHDTKVWWFRKFGRRSGTKGVVFWGHAELAPTASSKALCKTARAASQPIECIGVRESWDREELPGVNSLISFSNKMEPIVALVLLEALTVDG